MDNNTASRNRLLAERVIRGLESRNMTGYYAENKEEALKIALSLIPEGATVGWGGSVSVNEIGLKDAVISGNYNALVRENCKTPEEKEKLQRDVFFADYFLSSSNAVTEDGILVNIDGNANRIAAIAYGPKHVIMVVGMNKIARDLDAAISRARNVAAPINAQRFPLSTPCKKTGVCADCKSPDSICCEFLITRLSRHKDRIHVILVDEILGY